MIILGIIVFLLGLIGLRKYIRTNKYGLFTDATVTKVETGIHRHKQSIWCYDILHLTFTTEDGKRIDTKESEKEKSYHPTTTERLEKEAHTFQIGDTVRILYLSNDPQKVYIGSRMKTPVLSFVITLILGAALIIIGLIR